jgi:hypothetical protein
MLQFYFDRDRIAESTQGSKLGTLKISDDKQSIEKSKLLDKGFKSQKVAPFQLLKLKINDKTLKKYSFQKKISRFASIKKAREFVISDKDSWASLERSIHMSVSTKNIGEFPLKFDLPRNYTRTNSNFKIGEEIGPKREVENKSQFRLPMNTFCDSCHKRNKNYLRNKRFIVLKNLKNKRKIMISKEKFKSKLSQSQLSVRFIVKCRLWGSN